MKNLLLFTPLMLLFACGGAQQQASLPKSQDAPAKEMHSIAFYNVENLFDTQDDPTINDEDWLPTAEKKWDDSKYQTKLTNLSKVISQLGESAPAIIGFCEIENAKVLKDLLAQDLLKAEGYEIVHFDSPDERGIDVGLAYKKSLFKVLEAQPHKVAFPNRPTDRTRDILHVKGQFKGDELHVIVNHWPSRRGGEAESEPGRVMAASRARAIVDAILAGNANAKIILMGDFNDEPHNKSISEVLQAKGDMPSQGTLFNAMSALGAQGKGSLKYQENWNMIDQIIVSQALYDSKKGIDFIDGSAQIFSPEWLKQQEPEKYRGEPLRTFGGRKYLAGYSDHFPVFAKFAWR